MTAILDFDWQKGHSGELLPEDVTEKLNEVMGDRLENADMFVRHLTYVREPTNIAGLGHEHMCP